MSFIIYAPSGPLADFAYGLIRVDWNIQTANHAPNVCCMMVPPADWNCE